MKRTLLTIIAALFLGGVVNAQGWGETDSHAKSSNTPIVASVTLDGNAVTPTADYRLGAFVGEELRGLAAPHDNNFWIQVFYDQGTTEEITFKLWDPSGEGTELTDYTLTYGDLTALTTQEEGWGTPSDPVVLDFATTQMMTQTTTLVNGWNWWSCNVEVAPSEALQMLETSLGSNGVTITGQSTSVQNYYPYLNYNYWTGQLTDIDLAKGYKIQTSAQTDAVMVGGRVNPSDHPVTLINGWNWIGYPLSSSQTVNTAFGTDFVPTNNDIITGQSLSCTYWEGFGWYPQPITLEPGKSYLYQSNASSDRTFVYANSRNVVEAESIENDCFWQNDSYAFPDNAIMITKVFVDDVELRSAEVEIGAFVDGECRGSSMLFYFEPFDVYYAVLTIKGLEEDMIEFRMIDHSGIVSGESVTQVIFRNNLVLGALNNPFELRFNSASSTIAITYPNPIDRLQTFTLCIPDGEQVEELFIINSLGSIVRHLSGSITLTNLEGLGNTGVYHIKAVCKSGSVYNQKLIVK